MIITLELLQELTSCAKGATASVFAEYVAKVMDDHCFPENIEANRALLQAAGSLFLTAAQFQHKGNVGDDSCGFLKLIELTDKKVINQILQFNIAIFHQSAICQDVDVLQVLISKVDNETIKKALRCITRCNNSFDFSLLQHAVLSRRIEVVQFIYSLYLRYLPANEVAKFVKAAYESAEKLLPFKCLNIAEFLQFPPAIPVEMRSLQSQQSKLTQSKTLATDKDVVFVSNHLTDTEINAQIEPKFCKIVGDFGQGTGFIIDDQKGIILSSFHVINKRGNGGQWYPIRGDIPIEKELKAAAVLIVNGYLDHKFHPTGKALQVLTTSALLDLQVTESKTLSFHHDSREVSVTISLEDNTFLQSQRELIFNDLLSIVYKYFIQSTVKIHYDNEVLIGRIYIPDEKQNPLSLIRNYAYLDALPIKIVSFEDGTRFTSSMKIINTGEKIPEFPSTEPPLRIGEKVYFGGYPLTQEYYSFSYGMISAVIPEGRRNFIVIEAPVAPGNSGSPVFVQRNGQVYFIGVITSEVARVTRKMLEIREDLSHMSESISIVTPIGSLGVVGTLRELTETLLGNLSTGKGKAIVVQRIEQIFDETLSQQELLTDSELDFLVPKRLPEIPTVHRRLFEYINEKRITRLRVCDIVDYIRLYADKDSITAILGCISHKGLDSKKVYITFPLAPPLTRDTPAGGIADNRISCDTDEQKPVLLSLYCWALKVSEQQIQEGRYQFVNTDYVPVYSGLRFTQKFFTDHMGAGSRRRDEDRADSVAERRGVTISTTIAGTALQAISDEVEKLDKEDFYNDCIGKAKGAASERKLILISLFFLTIVEVQLHIRSTRNDDSGGPSRFFYSVVKKEDKHYMHHFERDIRAGIKADWEALPLGVDERRTVYYTAKPSPP